MPTPSSTAQSPPRAAEDHPTQLRDSRLSAVVEAAYILQAVGR
jgi:hypothetical protein